VILTAYLDESGTHGASPVTVMAGVMANAAQWARFEAEFAALKNKYGFRIFHTKKFKRRLGDFKGWDVFKQLALMLELAKLTEGAFTEAVTFTLSNAEYEASYKGGDKPRRLRLESRYGLCFRNCLLFLILEITKHGLDYYVQPPTLHLVIESGHRNWSEVRNIFVETKREIKDLTGFDILGDITFADKDECDPLMMADFLAHTAFMTAGGRLPPASNERPFSEPGPELPLGQSGVTSLRFGPGGLTALKSTLIERLAAKRGPSSAAPSDGKSS